MFLSEAKICFRKHRQHFQCATCSSDSAITTKMSNDFMCTGKMDNYPSAIARDHAYQKISNIFQQTLGVYLWLYDEFQRDELESLQNDRKLMWLQKKNTKLYPLNFKSPNNFN